MDHAWTFRPNLAREQLARIPGLAERMAALMDIEPEEFGSDEKRVTDEILVQMWRFANTYWVGRSAFVSVTSCLCCAPAVAACFAAVGLVGQNPNKKWRSFNTAPQFAVFVCRKSAKFSIF